MYQVKNCPKWITNHRYTVIRDCYEEPAPNNGYWYYGSYNTVDVASQVAREIGNGVVIESEQIEMIPPFNNFG